MASGARKSGCRHPQIKRAPEYFSRRRQDSGRFSRNRQERAVSTQSPHRNEELNLAEQTFALPVAIAVVVIAEGSAQDRAVRLARQSFVRRQYESGGGAHRLKTLRVRSSRSGKLLARTEQQSYGGAMFPQHGPAWHAGRYHPALARRPAAASSSLSRTLSPLASSVASLAFSQSPCLPRNSVS